MMRRDRSKKLTLITGGANKMGTADACFTSTAVSCSDSSTAVTSVSHNAPQPAANGCGRIHHNHHSKQVSIPPPLISLQRCAQPYAAQVCPSAVAPFPADAIGPANEAMMLKPSSTPSYLPLHGLPYSSIGVASPPSSRCYDIIEEEMIFPMSDITEEDEDRCGSCNKSKNKSSEPIRAKSPLTIPTIITEDVDCPDNGRLGSSNESGDYSPWQSRNINLRNSTPTGSQSLTQHCTSLPSSSVSASKSASANSVTMSGAETATHSSHYHTVHGTNQVGHHYFTTLASNNGSSEISATSIYSIAPHFSKQRTRSHSGPTYPVGFTQQVRHSALISAGMTTLGPSVHRRQSDDSEQTSSSLRSRISPNGSSFFDSFRPRSTSDGKCKKPSVIAAIKNNFLNRGNNSSSSGSSSSSSSSNSSTNVNGSNSGHQVYHHVHPSGLQHSTNINNTCSGGCTAQSTCCTTTSSSPASSADPSIAACVPSIPSSCGTGSVIDPFSLEYLYARSNSICECCPPAQQLLQHNQNQHQHNHHYHHQQRPRSRSGSSGPSSTMARVFDIIRGRSNSITATSAAGINAETSANCCSRSTIIHQDSICDREFEDIDETLVYVKFFRFYRCYDIIPISAKLVVFDTQLAVKKAFYALLSNGVRAAPLWDSSRHSFVGMLTITDFILILRNYYNSSHLKMEELEDHKLDIWRNMLKEKSRPLVSIEPDESLFNAIKKLIHNKVHRLPVIDPETGNVLYILTHKRILKFLFLYYYTRLPMPSFLMKSLREFPQIGTYENIETATQNTPLIEALNIMVDKRVSALPIVDKKNKVVEVYAKFDVIHLAADKMYQNLDITVKKALEYRAQSERVVKCTLNESLHSVLERIVQAEVHRIIVVDSEDHVIGIISLSDLLTFLVLRPVGLERKDIAVAQLGSNIKCCKVVEETAEEVLSDSQSSSCSSADLNAVVDTRATLEPDGLGDSEDGNRLSSSSSRSSAVSSSSMIVDGDQLSGNSSPATAPSNSKKLSNILGQSANKTLIAPLQ